MSEFREKATAKFREQYPQYENSDLVVIMGGNDCAAIIYPLHSPEFVVRYYYAELSERQGE